MDHQDYFQKQTPMFVMQMNGSSTQNHDSSQDDIFNSLNLDNNSLVDEDIISTNQFQSNDNLLTSTVPAPTNVNIDSCDDQMGRKSPIEEHNKSALKFSVFTADSIRLIAETSGVTEPPLEVVTSLAEDATYRMRQIINDAINFMRHAKRNKLKCSDINAALKWSDCQPTYGYECHPNKDLKYKYMEPAEVFAYIDEEVDLSIFSSDTHTSLRDQNLGKQPMLSKETTLERTPRITINWLR